MAHPKQSPLDAVREQEDWIKQCGGGNGLMGYLARYGEPGTGHCYGDGGEAIYRADTNRLHQLERAAGIR